jgi:hypothetical protein
VQTTSRYVHPPFEAGKRVNDARFRDTVWDTAEFYEEGEIANSLKPLEEPCPIERDAAPLTPLWGPVVPTNGVWAVNGGARPSLRQSQADPIIAVNISRQTTF